MNIVYNNIQMLHLDQKIVQKLGENIGYFESMNNTEMNKTIDMNQFGLPYDECEKFILSMVTNIWNIDNVNFELIDFFQIKNTKNIKFKNNILIEVLYDKVKFVQRVEILCRDGYGTILNEIPFQFYLEYIRDNTDLLMKVFQLIDMKFENINEIYDFIQGNQTFEIVPDKIFRGYSVKSENIIRYKIVQRLKYDFGPKINYCNSQLKIDVVKFSDIDCIKLFPYKCLCDNSIYDSLSKRYGKSMNDVNLLTCSILDFKLTLCMIPHPSNILIFKHNNEIYYIFLPFNIMNATDIINC